MRNLYHEHNQGERDAYQNLMGQPDPFWKSTFRVESNAAPTLKANIVICGVLFLVLLGIPALNLNSIISTRMEKRLPEIGIRKAFGAKKRELLSQILWENLLLTCLGGIFGLLLAWLALIAGNTSVLNLIIQKNYFLSSGIPITHLYNAGMLFSPVVFLIAFLFCAIMNLLSAIVPTINILKKDIIYSLNEKL